MENIKKVKEGAIKILKMIFGENIKPNSINLVDPDLSTVINLTSETYDVSISESILIVGAVINEGNYVHTNNK